MTEPTFQLSLAGSRRKDQILRVALRQARSRRHRRLATRGVLVALIFAALATTWPVISVRKTNRQRADVLLRGLPQPPPVDISPTLVHPRGLTIIWIQTDPKILKHMEALIPQVELKHADDDELIKSLAEAGKPSGLLEVDGKSILLPRD